MAKTKPWAPHRTDKFLLAAGDAATETHRYLSVAAAGVAPMLACVDVPYNIGQPYTDYIDKKTKAEFIAYLRPRVQATYDVLHPHGSYWIAINDANQAEVKLMCEDIGFFIRKHVIAWNTFGQNNAHNFTSSHIHWFYFTKHQTKFVFNADDPANRVPSARQLEYNDKRANPRGRLPDSVWILRPQWIEPAPAECLDTWYFSRVCGTYKEKAKGFANQIPVPMLERIIRFCSNPGDLVFDNFMGTGSCGEAALRLGRKFVGIDISPACVEYAAKRLQALVIP